jgi:hypothetical protein
MLPQVLANLDIIAKSATFQWSQSFHFASTSEESRQIQAVRAGFPDWIGLEIIAAGLG